MNRRDFFKTTALGIGATALIPTLALAANEVPLYKQFDWLYMPTSLLFRIKSYDDGRNELEYVPVAVKSLKLKLYSDINVDYTQNQIKEKVVFKGFRNESLYSYNQTYYTNELLLNEAKDIGLTHIYQFGRVEVIVDTDSYKKMAYYYVRGVKKPDWKTVDGKLQIVKN